MKGDERERGARLTRQGKSKNEELGSQESERSPSHQSPPPPPPPRPTCWVLSLHSFLVSAVEQ